MKSFLKVLQQFSLWKKKTGKGGKEKRKKMDLALLSVLSKITCYYEYQKTDRAWRSVYASITTQKLCSSSSCFLRLFLFLSTCFSKPIFSLCCTTTWATKCNAPITPMMVAEVAKKEVDVISLFFFPEHTHIIIIRCWSWDVCVHKLSKWTPVAVFHKEGKIFS